MKKESEAYLEHITLKGYTESTIKSRQDTIKHFMTWSQSKGKHKWQGINVEDLKAYIKYNQEHNYSQNTQDTRIRGIKKLFDYLEKQQQILINPFERLRIPKRGGRLPKDILSEEEVDQLLNIPDLTTKRGIRNRAIMELLYSTGLRRKECYALKIFDLDLDNGYVRINQGKGKKDRVIPLGKKACYHIKQYIEKVRNNWAKDPDCEHLFLKGINKPLDHQGINVLIKEYGRQLKLGKPVTTHSFRRAAVTHMLRGGASPLYLQRMLGHATNASMKHYIKVSAQDIKTMHLAKHPRERKRT